MVVGAALPRREDPSVSPDECAPVLAGKSAGNPTAPAIPRLPYATGPCSAALPADNAGRVYASATSASAVVLRSFLS